MSRKKKMREQSQAIGQMTLGDFVPKPVIPWETKLVERPKPGTPEYREWWRGLTREQQELALELRQREKDGVNSGTEETYQQSEE